MTNSILFHAQVDQYKIQGISFAKISTRTDSINCVLPGIDIYGASSHASGEAHNLLDIDLLASPDSGNVTLEKGIKGTSIIQLNINEDENSTYYDQYAAIYSGTVLDNIKSKLVEGQYAVVVAPKDITCGAFNILFLDDSDAIVSRVAATGTTPAGSSRMSKVSITAAKIALITKMAIVASSEVRLQNVAIYSSGDISLSSNPGWQPFGGEYKNYPNPDSPSDIITAGKNIMCRVRGKNLCDLDYLIAHKGENSSGGYSGPKIFVGKGNKITVSIAEVMATGLGFYMCVANQPGSTGANSSSSQWIYHSGQSSLCRQSITFTASADYIYVCCSNITKFAANAGYLQIEVATAATEYEPRVEPCVINIPESITLPDGSGILELKFSSITQTSGGLIRDSLSVDSRAGTVIYNKRIGIKSFTGNETFSLNSATKSYITAMPSDAINTNNSSCLCNYFRNMAYNELPNTDLGLAKFCQYSGRFFFNLDNGAAGVTNFKKLINQWHTQGKPLTVYYRLKSIYSYDISDTDFGRQILSLVQPDKNMVVEAYNDNGLSMNLSVKYLTHA